MVLSQKKDYEIILMINQSPSPNLAAQIVAYKTIGYNKKIAMICMHELARRRDLGEEFNYEEYIDIEIKKIPVVSFNFNVSNVSTDIKSNIEDLIKTIKK